MDKNKDEFFMQRCLQLAAKGLGKVQPNPLVGCVLVYQNSVISEGYHHKYGGAHAEVNAIDSLKDKSLLKKCTMYVNLEPCSHHGKTPPCSDLIIKSGIPKIVIGSVDPFTEVNGKGIERLQKAGVKVKYGILDKSNKQLNKRFYTFHTKKRPYIILKWAQTDDGFIDNVRIDPQIPALKLSNSFFQKWSHKLRAKEQAIMVGYNTVILDNPQLNVRKWYGPDPLRIGFIDRKTPVNSNLIERPQKTWLFSKEHMDKVNGMKVFEYNAALGFWDTLNKKCIEEQIQSIIVEGGSKILNFFINQSLFDEIYINLSGNFLNKGLKAPNISHNNFYKVFDYKGQKLITNKAFSTWE